MVTMGEWYREISQRLTQKSKGTHIILLAKVIKLIYSRVDNVVVETH